MANSPSRREQLGEQQQAAAHTLEWLDAHYGMISSPQSEQFLLQLIERLNAGQKKAEKLCHRALPRVEKFRVFLLNDSQPNAFSLGSGTIVLSSGLVAALESTAELAAVISHEMSHEFLGHVAHAEEEETGPGPQSYLSKDQEVEADSLSLCLLSASGIPLDSAVTALTKGYRRENAAVSQNTLVTQRIVEIERRLPALPRCSSAMGCAIFPDSKREFRRFQRGVRESLATNAHSRDI